MGASKWRGNRSLDARLKRLEQRVWAVTLRIEVRRVTFAGCHKITRARSMWSLLNASA